MFMGTRDALDAHYNTKHPGKAPAVKTKVEDPAEIAAWIAERKKKYPTKDAVQQKKQTHQEKLNSGMILQTRQTATKSHTTRQTTDTSAASPSSPTKKRRRNSLSDGPDAHNDDEEGQIHSSDDDDEDDKLDVPESSGKPVHKKKQLPCKYFASGKCKNGDNCMFLHIKEASIGPEKPALGGGKRRNLRSMLLEGQVRRQNNIILQCIRFLIKDGRLVKPVEDGSGKEKGKAVEPEHVSETKQEVKDMEDVSDHMSVS
ncbi:hypothetical protein HDU99_000050 [Rhizoclosmatium hyalinum]|nr:hypothetical protein HDU99_000050 [Rhizoclosmatium hyalinum]